MSRHPLRPIYVVSKKEFKTNLLSVRMAILVAILALVVVGGSYGFAGLSTGPSAMAQLVLWAHPIAIDDQPGIAVFASDAWGVPHGDLGIELSEIDSETGREVPLETLQTDADGFARFLNLAPGFYVARGSLGFVEFDAPLRLSGLPLGNLSHAEEIYDLDNTGLPDHLAIHFMDTSGVVPQGVEVFLEDELMDAPDSRGFLALKLREGENNLTFVYGEEAFGTTIFLRQSPGSVNPFAQGPDFVLFLIATSFGSLLLPIAAIALSYDSISKEKVQGSAELLLYRPASWRKIGIGKFLGVFAAVALPVTAVNVAGVLIITAVTGRWPSSNIVLGFVAFSLFLLAVYILLMQTLSTLARTGGTAILFGVVLWFVFTLLWSVIILLVSIVAGVPFGSREYFVMASYAGLFNPSSLYSTLFFQVAPEGFQALLILGGISGPFALPNWVPALAAVVWIAVLLILFLEVFRRKAAG